MRTYLAERVYLSINGTEITGFTERPLKPVEGEDATGAASATVALDGIGDVRCWAPLFCDALGRVYMGEPQMAPIGPLFTPPPRRQLRRVFTEEDEETLRAELLAKVGAWAEELWGRKP